MEGRLETDPTIIRPDRETDIRNPSVRKAYFCHNDTICNLSVPASLNCPPICGVTRKISACFLKPKLAKANYIQENPWMSECRVPQYSPSDASVALPATTALGAMASPACANGAQCCFYGTTQQQVASQAPFNNLSALT